MIEAFKKIDKKFLIIAGVVVCLPIVIILVLVLIQGCSNRKITPEKYETKMIESTKKYLIDSNKIPVEEGEIKTIKLSTLVKKGYIKSTEELLNDSSCDGSVSVRRNGASVDINNGGFLNYTVDLECKNYSTVHLVDKVMDNLVTSESGLYKDGENYIFKGDKLKNYISFYGHIYRIMSIDKDGILKLVKEESEYTQKIWDNKYNIETNRNSGKNIYKDSLILKYLIEDYKNPKKISSKAKEHVVAYDTCVGKRDINNNAIDISINCFEKTEKQIISLLNISDYAKASLDVNCIDLKSRSCNNYNYLYEFISSSWTPNSVTNNTYEIVYLSDGLMEVQDARESNIYNFVIYIDGNELFTSGSGTDIDPYLYE